MYRLNGLTSLIFQLAASCLLAAQFALGQVVEQKVWQPPDAAGHIPVVTLVLSGSEPVYQQTQAAFEQALPPGIRVHSVLYDAWRGDQSDVVVAIGAAATQRIMASPADRHHLSILLPSNTFTKLLEQHPKAASKLAQGRLSAIFMNQPAQRQLNLANLVVPQLRSVGTLFDNLSKSLVQELSETAEGKGLQFQSRELLARDNPVAVLREMYADIDLFLAVPGRYIFNRSIAKWMLYLSYRNRKPLIGFSDDYVQAGALAAVYSEPEDISRQAAEIVQSLLGSSEHLPAPQFPKYFSVSVNRQVASRLGAKLPAPDQIVTQLRDLEQRQ